MNMAKILRWRVFPRHKVSVSVICVANPEAYQCRFPLAAKAIWERPTRHEMFHRTELSTPYVYGPTVLLFSPKPPFEVRRSLSLGEGIIVVFRQYRFRIEKRTLWESKKIVNESSLRSDKILETARSSATSFPLKMEEHDGREWDTVQSGKMAEAPTICGLKSHQ